MKMLHSKLLVSIVVVVIVNFIVCDELHEGDPGVCIRSARKTVTKRCPTRRKICQETKSEWRLVCCKGYEFVDSKCKPLCKFGCHNGTCIAPDECHCDEPYVLENSTCVTPTCEPPCFNGHCIARDTCKCADGFITFNKTHCAPSCPPGYFNDPIECKPKCDERCSNGTCVEPNKCNCNTGYKNAPDNKFNCLPICEPECVNGNCVSPNTCSCYKKYEMAGNGTCKPQCGDCSNGECVAPDECRCHDGYSMTNGTCTPQCSKECVNGYCSQPETCECSVGYNISSSDKYVCEPVCSSGCVNATCITPDRCECLARYEPTEDKNICKPTCESCGNGTCVAPDECECHDGYNMTDGVCKPICSNFCVNGDCIAPNKCNCHRGYRENETSSHLCYKPCEGPCENGICYLDGMCLCNRGFEYDTNNKTCIRMEEVSCKSCNSSCIESPCFCDNGAPCHVLLGEPDEVTSSRLASMEMTWIFGGAVLILLLVLVVAVMIQTWKRRPLADTKAQDEGRQYMSVGFIAPHTLKSRAPQGDEYVDDFYEELQLKSQDEEAGKAERLQSLE